MHSCSFFSGTVTFEWEEKKKRVSEIFTRTVIVILAKLFKNVLNKTASGTLFIK